MKKFIACFGVCSLLSGAVSATEIPVAAEDSTLRIETPYFEMLSPTYLTQGVMDEGWKSNWFFGLSGGWNSFIGSPTGCGDFGKRMTPQIQGYVGKWFSPFAACRLTFEGLKMHDALNRKEAFQHLHVDFLYNVSSHFRNGFEELPKWDVIPYLGVGCWHYKITGGKPFAMSAGLLARYRVLDRMHVTGELGWSTTWADLDGIGKPNRLGDHLFKATVGLSLTLGKNGWKKVIDAKPYIYQNDALIQSLKELGEMNERLNKMLAEDQAALREMRKIMEIEGLLEKYSLSQRADRVGDGKVKNNYSGLNSLRQRMKHKDQGGEDGQDMLPVLTERYRRDSLDMMASDYIKAVRNNREGIGSPIYFFFKKGTATLTEPSQMVNLDAIAKVAAKYDLCAGIVGAADSETGTAQINDSLSNQRATYIEQLLLSKGLKQDQVFTNYLGGINRYEPKEANRQSCVILFFRKQEF